MEILRSISFKTQVGMWTLSLLLHLILLTSIQYIPRPDTSKTYERVRVNVTQKPKVLAPKAATSADPHIETVKPPPKPKALKKNVAPTPNSTPPPAPVMGLNKDSFAEDGKGGFAAPAGNTTMMADDGRRLSPEDIKKLDRNLSEDATLIASSFIKPEYTPQAEETGLEGSFVIEVYVDAKGNVIDAELRKKIGYGMDERVLNAARQAKFSPRKDPLGQPLAGWTELKIRLTIE